MTTTTPNISDEIKQIKELFSVYNRLAETCFNDCVFDFTTRAITDKENRCTDICFDKSLKMNARISQRFQEYQLIKVEKTQEQEAAKTK